MRLIDADALKVRIMMDVPVFSDGVTKAFILAMLETRSVTPTIDAVPVIRCKDCMHYRKDTCSAGAGMAFPPPDNYFCADGERENNNA